MAAGRKPRQSGQHPTLECPRCGSGNTKFCYYNNYNTSQPRHYCRDCERYWTHGGALRNIPAGGGGIKKRGKRTGTQPKNPILINDAAAIPGSSNHIPNPMLLPQPMFYGSCSGGGGGVALGGSVGLPPFNPGGFVSGFSAFQSFNPQFPLRGFNMDQQMNAAAASAFFAAAPMNNTGINGGGNQEGEGDGFWNRLVLGRVGNGGNIPGGNGVAPPIPLPPPPPPPPPPPSSPPPTTTSSSFM